MTEDVGFSMGGERSPMRIETDNLESREEEEESLPRLSAAAVLRLLALARPYRALLIVAGLLMLASAGISLSLPLLTQGALDQVLKTRQVAALDRLALGLFGLILVTALLSFAQFMLMAYAGNRVVMDMRARLFAHLQRLPVAFFDRTRSGDLASRLSNDVTLLQHTLTEDIVRFVSNSVTLVGGIVLAVVIDWRLTGVVVGLLALMLGLLLFCGLRLRRLTGASLDALSDAMGAMTEVLSNVRLVKAFAREAHEDERVMAKLRRVFQLAMRSSRFEAVVNALAGVGFLAVLLGVIWYGGRSVLMGHLSAGTILGFLMTLTIIGGPMASLAELYARLQRAAGAADRLFAILDDAPEAPDSSDAVPFPEGPGAIEVRNIRFAYEPDRPVLRELSLFIPPGRVTALVGASGSGKTTLTALLYRFYEPQSGEIRIDGTPITRIARRALREHIGLVPQEPILFNATIRENIRYGRLDATDAEVEAAARAANVEEFVTALPKQYETVIGERGVTLSGGQRQRIAIARAVLKDPRVLILDEATSALDNRSERLVREALERLMRGRTTIVIAHRLTTIRHAHQIAVMDEGRIVERGTHDALMDASGPYALLHDSAQRIQPPAQEPALLPV